MNFRQLSILITVIWLGIFVLAPHALVILTSLMTPDNQHLARWPITWDAYLRIKDSIYAHVFWQSLQLSAIATSICLVVGYPFSWMIAKVGGVIKTALLFLMIVPFWTNSLIRTYAIKLLLGAKGVINASLLSLGIVDSPLYLLYSPFAVVFGLVYLLFPFMVLPLVASFDHLDKSLLEAGHDLGAGFFQRFWYIVLPLTAPGIIAGCLIVFLPAMGMFYVADLLGGAKNLLLGNVIKNQFLMVRDWPFGSALSVTLIGLMAGVLWFYHRANKKLHRQGGLEDDNL